MERQSILVKILEQDDSSTKISQLMLLRTCAMDRVGSPTSPKLNPRQEADYNK